MTRLEYERRRRRWNQTEAAYHSRLTQSQISLLERRLLIPTNTITERLGRALGVPPERLFEDVAEPELRVLAGAAR